MKQDIFACGESPRTLVAINWSSRRYATWTHAALQENPYKPPRATLCGHHPPENECRVVAEGDDVLRQVTCNRCKRSLQTRNT